VVIVLANESRFANSKAEKEEGFLGAIKIRSTTFFGGKVKPSAPCQKILRRVKESCGVRKIFRRQNSPPFLSKYILIRY
jgi:hypothetical protein